MAQIDATWPDATPVAAAAAAPAFAPQWGEAAAPGAAKAPAADFGRLGLILLLPLGGADAGRDRLGAGADVLLGRGEEPRDGTGKLPRRRHDRRDALRTRKRSKRLLRAAALAPKVAARRREEWRAALSAKLREIQVRRDHLSSHTPVEREPLKSGGEAQLLDLHPPLRGAVRSLKRAATTAPADASPPVPVGQRHPAT